MSKSSKMTKINFTPLAIMLVGIAAYLGFYPLFQMFQSGAIKELLAAIFGALVVTFITLLQLRQQSEVSDQKEKQTQIFKEKLAVFKEYLMLVQDVVLKMRAPAVVYTDEEKSADTVKIIFILSKLRLHCESDSVKRIGYNLLQIMEKRDDGSADSYTIDYLFDTCEAFRGELFPEDRNKFLKNEYLDISDIQTTMKGMRHTIFYDSANEEEDTKLGEDNSLGSKSQIFYANLGGRSWNDMRRYGFWQAGGTERIIKGMRKIKKGDVLCAYSSGDGYVGIGIVIDEAEGFAEYKTLVNGELQLLSDIGDETTKSFLPGGARYNNSKEYVIPVKWEAHTLRERSDAFKKSGLFAAPMTSCKLSDKNTIDSLRIAFDYDFK